MADSLRPTLDRDAVRLAVCTARGLLTMAFTAAAP
jgi:hypothetical protein